MYFPDDHLESIFRTREISIVGKIVRGDGSSDVYVQIEYLIKPDGSKSPTRAQLLELKQEFENINLNLHLLLVNRLGGQFEELLRATLFLAFPDQLRNVFCSIQGKAASVWVEPKQALTPTSRSAIETAAKKFCESQEIDLVGFASIGDAEMPGKFAILSTLKLIAPANLTQLAYELTQKGFTVPSEDWLARRLDVIRKAHGVLFTADKRYALTGSTLKALGTSKNGKRSLDVRRLLALWKISG